MLKSCDCSHMNKEDVDVASILIHLYCAEAAKRSGQNANTLKIERCNWVLYRKLI